MRWMGGYVVGSSSVHGSDPPTLVSHTHTHTHTYVHTHTADNSRKAYYREFRKVVELSDVIIQVCVTVCVYMCVCVCV